jgi:hypothetical protein
MGTLRGFPNPPALWLRQAKPAYAYAVMGTLRGFPNPRHPPPTLPPPRYARPRTLWLRRAKPAYYAVDYGLTVPALDVLHKGGQAGCRGQVVRQGSAKPLFPGSNPGGTSTLASPRSGSRRAQTVTAITPNPT